MDKQYYIGKKFNRLLILSFDHKKENGHNYYRCHCNCGIITIASIGNLKSGHTKSCGCLSIENSKKPRIEKRTNGISKTRVYRCWQDMNYRCYNPKNSKYSRYGQRGIIVCVDWKYDVLSFYNWALTNGYKDGLTLDRINVDGNYEPSNCRWATVKQQANNTSTNMYIEYNGERLTYEQWGDRLGGCKGFIWNRINMGWNEIDAITIPKKRQGSDKYLSPKIEYNGEVLTYSDWSLRLGGSSGMVGSRILILGWDAIRAITTPPLANGYHHTTGNERYK